MDRVKPLKLESADSGGTQLDEFPSSLDPNEDGVDCRRVFLQDDASDDEAVYAERDGSGNMRFVDQANPTGKTLASLGAGGFDINDIVWDDAGGLVYEDAGTAVTKA